MCNGDISSLIVRYAYVHGHITALEFCLESDAQVIHPHACLGREEYSLGTEISQMFKLLTTVTIEQIYLVENRESRNIRCADLAEHVFNGFDSWAMLTVRCSGSPWSSWTR